MAHALENSIREKESRIRTILEDTGLISNIEFHDHNFFSIKFQVYNNQRAKKVISDCYKETSKRLREQVKYISLHNEGFNGEVRCRIEVDPTKKGANSQIIDSVLTYLEQDLRSYIQIHEAEIRAYRMLKQKRTKCS